jgi:hypothetical protein
MVQYIGVIGAYLNGARVLPSRPRPTHKSLDLRDEYMADQPLVHTALVKAWAAWALIWLTLFRLRGASLDPIP